jgi:hypothetical protein
MKTISLEQVEAGVSDALKRQRRGDPILLTVGSDVLGLLLPAGMKQSDVDSVVWLEEPMGHIVVTIETKHGPHQVAEFDRPQPVFGSCKGMLTIVSDDDEHLLDFEEYMR